MKKKIIYIAHPMYGDRISNGMAQEIAWANSLGIPVVSMSKGIEI